MEEKESKDEETCLTQLVEDLAIADSVGDERLLRLIKIAIQHKHAVTVFVLSKTQELAQKLVLEVEHCAEPKPIVVVVSSQKQLQARRKEIDPKSLVFILTSKLDPPIAPAYYGIFPHKQDLIDVAFHKDLLCQETPLHITCHFVGQSTKKHDFKDSLLLGTMVSFTSIGLSKNEAGCAVVIECPSFPKANHITIMTKKPARPVDVGLQITTENTTLFEPLPGSGLFLPYF